MLTAAALAKETQSTIGSITLLAAQTDFSKAGELMLFIDHSQVAYLEDKCGSKGIWMQKHMGGAFQLLRSNDLIWSKYWNEYLMGKRSEVIDLIAWNNDPNKNAVSDAYGISEKLFFLTMIFQSIDIRYTVNMSQ